MSILDEFKIENEKENFVLDKLKTNSSIKIDCCQLCLQNSNEDYFLICDSIIKPLLEANCSQSQDNYRAIRVGNLFTMSWVNSIVEHSAFKKILEFIFEPKYKEVNKNCSHITLKKKIFEIFDEKKGGFTLKSLNIEKIFKNIFTSLRSNELEFSSIKEKFEELSQKIFGNQNIDEFLNYNEESQIINKDSCESHKKKQSHIAFNKNQNKNNLQMKSIEILQKWFLDNIENPYPSIREKKKLSCKTKMKVKQIQNWFTNCRKRYLDPLKKDDFPTNQANQDITKKKKQNKKLLKEEKQQEKITEKVEECQLAVKQLKKDEKLQQIISESQKSGQIYDLKRKMLRKELKQEENNIHSEEENLEKKIENLEKICDKSVILYDIEKKNYNQDDEQIQNLSHKDLLDLLKKQQIYYKQQLSQLIQQQQKEKQIRLFYQQQLTNQQQSMLFNWQMTQYNQFSYPQLQQGAFFLPYPMSQIYKDNFLILNEKTKREENLLNSI